MRVEFLGIPGAGKTTLANDLLRALNGMAGAPAMSADEAADKALREKGVGLYGKKLAALLKVARRLFGGGAFRPLDMVHRAHADALKARAFSEFRLERADLCELVARTVSGLQAEESKAYLSSAFFDLAATFQLARPGEGNAVVVFDEGFVNRALSIWVRDERARENDTDIDRYLGLAPRSDLVVFVKAPPEECLARLRQRGHTPTSLRGLTGQDRADRMAVFHMLALRVADALPRSGVQVLPVDNDDPEARGIPDAVVEAIHQAREASTE